MNEDTNVEVEQPTGDVQEAPQEAVTEETAPVEEASQEAETTEQPSEDVKDINLDDFVQERYQTAPAAQSQSIRQEVAQELSQLPTDEYGTVDSNAAADWFANRIEQAETRATQAAVAAAQEIFMSNTAERAQQEQLLKKYPEITKDKGTLETVFDLRDAAALRGETLSLTQAAAKLDKLRQNGAEAATQSANRKTTIQAAAHLETSGARKGQQTKKADLTNKNDRSALLKQYVDNLRSEGTLN